MTSARYFFVFMSLLLLLSIAVAALNRVVDPFWYYRDVSIAGFNAVKPKFLRYERHVKPALVQREQPASLIFGSSFSEIGFNPKHPALNAVGRSYNFALAGAPWEMVNCNVQFALKHDRNLRQIVLGIHPTALPGKDCSADIRKMESPDEQAFLFSYDAFEASINTLLEQGRHKPSHTADGLYFYSRGAAGTANRFQQDFNHIHAQPCPPGASRTGAQRSVPPPLDLSGLQELLAMTKARDITLKLVVYPSHALALEQQYQCATRQNRWNALREIAHLVEHSSGSATVWDFEGYHEVGTEPISEAPAVYWQDLSHFNSEFGDLMLDEMFAIQPPRLGIQLTTDNIEARVQAEVRMREDYLRAHPEFQRQLQTMLSRH